MRSINLIFTSLFLGFVFCVNGQAQNPAWSLPKYFATNIGQGFTASNLPTSYTGNSASNMQLDANGDILFYIVDNDVFDSDGVSIGNFSSFYQSNNYLPYMCLGLAQTSEIVVLPDPNSCSKYYIISSAQTTRECNGTIYTEPFPNNADPFVAVIDFDLPRPNNPNKSGAISSVEFLQNINGVPGISWIGTDYTGGVLLAASKLMEDEGKKSRFVFVSADNEIIRFKIGGNGMLYDGRFPFENQNATGGSRSEMELINLPNGNFRIACPYGTNGSHNNIDLAAAIYITDLDASGSVISGTENTLYFYTNGKCFPAIIPLEHK